MRIAVIGDLLYDCFIWSERLPRMGETVTEFFTGCYQAEHNVEEWKRLVMEAFRKERARNLILTLGAEGSLYAGGLAVTKRGSLPSLPQKEDLELFIRRNIS